jgi:hypothetical protein
MGWERGYYYSARKVNGRVVREYWGRGEAGQLAAELDARERRERAEALAAAQARIADLDELEAAVVAADKALELAAHAALLAAGFRQHKRGEWRKKRVRKTT